MIEEQYTLPAIPAELIPSDIGDGIPLIKTTRLTPDMLTGPASGVARSLAAIDGKMAYANELHRQCIDITNQVQRLGNRMWQTAVVLGAVLTQVKKECPHGEWGKLFNDADKRIKSSPNVPHVGHFTFGKSSASRYMKLYKTVTEKSKGLTTQQSFDLESLQKGESYDIDALSGTLSQLTDATTLRQAFFDLGVLTPPKNKTQAMLENRADGRPKDANDADPDAILAEQKRLAQKAVSTFAVTLEAFMAEGRYSLLDSEMLSVFADTLSASLGRVTEAIKARRSKTDSSDGTPILTFNSDDFELPEVSIL